MIDVRYIARFPDGSTRAAGFDNLGQQLWAVDERGVAVTNAYDSLGRLKRSAYIPYAAESMPADVTDLPSGCTPAACDEDQIYGGFTGQAISFDAYDPNGNLLSMTDWAGTKSYEYDALNRCTYVKEDHSSTFGFHYAITNAYDLAGSRVTNNYVIAATGANRWHQNVSLFDGLGRIRTNVVSLSSLASPSPPRMPTIPTASSPPTASHTVRSRSTPISSATTPRTG